MVKEPGLKLFGRNILLADKGRTAAGEYSGESSVESGNGGAAYCGGSLDVGRGRKGGDGGKAGGEEKQGRAYELQKHQEEEEEEMEEDIYKDNDQDLNQNPDDSPNPTAKPVAPGPPKALKKPEKILPCPRCKSPDTKFCYFNNYNVNQPRHFCKACQRYWTAGGTMRDVPVGSGRRKNKSHFSAGRPGPNGGVLSFGPAFPWPFPAFCPPCCYHSTPGWDEGFSGPVRMGQGKRSREGEGSERGWMWSSVEARFDLVKALQPRGEMKKSSVVGSSLLQANPAAFSRSVSFRERV